MKLNYKFVMIKEGAMVASVEQELGMWEAVLKLKDLQRRRPELDIHVELGGKRKRLSDMVEVIHE